MELASKKWKEFKVNNIFKVSTGSLIPKEIFKKGKIARLTATDNNNGIFDFYEKMEHKNYREVSNFISVSFLGSVFYHPYSASLDMKIHAVQIKNIELNRYIAEFLVSCFKRMTLNFSYGNQLSSTDLPKKKILLPINSKNEPDYAFMENYMRQKETRLLKQYKKQVSEFENVVPLSEKEWKEIFIEDVFEIKSGKRLTKADMISGNIPFVGATDSNNGITEFIANKNSSLDKNVLGVNYNGSVVFNFYHPYKAVFSDDVKRLSFKEKKGNKYSFLFVKALILQQKSKYEYGYKFNGERMKRQKILLPINSQGKPDYAYMENYMKALESKKIKQFISFSTL